MKELCRMEVKVWLSGIDPDIERMFLESSLTHLISVAMTESPLIRYVLDEHMVSHISYPEDNKIYDEFDTDDNAPNTQSR